MDLKVGLKKRKKISRPIVLTIGHSTRPLQDFIEILKENEISHVIDIRTIPRSAYNPQYNQSILSKELRAQGIKYLHMKGLGGLRYSRKDSPNTAWRNASFRGFADYMQTKEFEKNIDLLMKYVKKHRVVLMCAEAVPWRCHRSLIGDALLARKIKVEDIISISNRKKHSLTPWAKVKGKKVTYPGEEEHVWKKPKRKK